MSISHNSGEIQDIDKAVNGLKKIRIGTLLEIISSLLAVGAIIIILMTFLAMPFYDLASPEELLSVMIGGGIGILLSILLIIVLTLVAIFVFIIPGTSALSRWRDRFSTSSKLMKIGFGGGFILAFIAILIIVASIFTYNLASMMISLILIIPAGILALIGYIGLIVLSFNLKGEFDEMIFLVAGILFIINLIVSVAGIIAWILMYIGLGSAIRKLEREKMVKLSPSSPSVV